MLSGGEVSHLLQQDPKRNRYPARLPRRSGPEKRLQQGWERLTVRLL